MAIGNEQIMGWLRANPGASDADIFAAMNQHGVTPEQLAQATGGNIQNIQARYGMQQAQQPTQPAGPTPQTGLMGFENALRGGMEGSLGALNTGMQGANQALTQNFSQGLNNLNQRTDQAMGMMQPFAQRGGQAFDLQAALSGAMGGDAQSQAFQNFQQSPGQQYLMEQAEKSLLRNASATGGLGGGAIKNALQRNAIGMASQDFGNQFARLGQVAQPGMQAAGTQAGLAQGAGTAGLGASMGLGQALAGNQMSNAANQANVFTGTGNALAGGRMDTGNRMAAAISDTTSALSGLRDAQGRGMADMIGQNSGNLASLLQGSGINQSQLLAQLPQLLAQYGMGEGQQIAGLPGIPGTQQSEGMLGGVGQLLGGIGGLMTGWGFLGGGQPSMDFGMAMDNVNPTNYRGYA